MFCAISGQPPEEPVVSVKTGHIFDRKLIEAAIVESGKCPVSGVDLAADDLITVKVAGSGVRPPRPATSGASVPALLASLRTEWDATMLETHTLRTQLHSARTELSHALYQHDAACRVIARLVAQRDELKAQLADSQAQIRATAGSSARAAAPAGDSAAMDTDGAVAAATTGIAREAGLSDEACAEMEGLAARLSKARKKAVKSVPADLASPETIGNFAQLSEHFTHSASPPGVLALDVHPADADMVATGGADGNVIVYRWRPERSIVCRLSAGPRTGSVNSLCFHRIGSPGSVRAAVAGAPLLFSGHSDASVRIWKGRGERGDLFELAETQTGVHKGAIVSLDLHPSGDFFVSASRGGSWAISRAEDGQLLRRVESSEDVDGLTIAKFHPDGLILGTGAKAVVRVWDVKKQINIASFGGHRGNVLDLDFSQNGYYLATTAEDNTVKLWDLRKLANFRTVPFSGGKHPTRVVRFDSSGQYLAVGAGSDIQVLATKTWAPVVTLAGNSGPVTALDFGPNASWLASTSMDRSLRFFGVGE